MAVARVAAAVDLAHHTRAYQVRAAGAVCHGADKLMAQHPVVAGYVAAQDLQVLLEGCIESLRQPLLVLWIGVDSRRRLRCLTEGGSMQAVTTKGACRVRGGLTVEQMPALSTLMSASFASGTGFGRFS
jgi:hypothetical protein